MKAIWVIPGIVIECTTCHEGDLGNTLNGPHGMHPVGGSRFVDGGHEEMSEHNLGICSTCQGVNGEGTVLSEVSARVVNERISLST